MAGGAGTRFWPLSRRAKPKQLLPIASERTMLQDTAARLFPLIPAERIVVVTGHEHAAAVRRQLPNVPRANILIEPIGRNTAPCIALAAEWIHRRAPKSAMAVFPADHAIRDPGAFRRTVKRAFGIAESDGALVTLGVRPTHPETGYGYIKVGVTRDHQQPRAFRVEQFKEKPTAGVARRYVTSGEYLWNAGIFAWRTDVIRAELARRLPEVHAVIAKLPLRSPRVPRRAYESLRSLPIDIAVMEPAARSSGPPVAVVAADFGWTDVGSWVAASALWAHDGQRNAVRGRAVLIDCSGATVYGDASRTGVVALIGMRDTVVVETRDALLVCPADRAQEVRTVVAELERRGWREFL